MEKEPKRRDAKTLPQGAVTEFGEGDRLLRAIVETALEIVYTEDEFDAFLRALPSANETAAMDRTARILHLPRTALWEFLILKNWWNVDLKDGDRYDDGLSLMAEIVRITVRSQCIGARDVFMAAEPASLARHLAGSAVHHPMSLQIILDKLFKALIEKEQISLNETFKIIDPEIFVRAIGVANAKSRILHPLAERFRWEMEDVRPSGGSTTQPYPPPEKKPEPPHAAAVAANILTRKPSNPAMRTVRRMASRYPTPSAPPDSDEDQLDESIPLTMKKPRSER